MVTAAVEVGVDHDIEGLVLRAALVAVIKVGVGVVVVTFVVDCGTVVKPLVVDGFGVVVVVCVVVVALVVGVGTVDCLGMLVVEREDTDGV